MKRLIVSVAIIGIIIAVGVFAIMSVGSKNQRLYGHIEAVIREYESGGDTRAKIDELEEYFRRSYSSQLSCFVDDDELQEMEIIIAKLKPMLDSDCDEFTAECESLRLSAKKLYLNEVPCFSRIL